MRKKENIKELLLRLMSRHKAVMSDSDGDETVATEKFPAMRSSLQRCAG